MTVSTTDRPYAIRERREDELSSILDLMRDSLGETEILQRTESMWKWKHEINPFGASHVLLAESATQDQQLIGLRAFLRWEFERSGTTFRAVRAVDTSTHPNFRRLGLFKNLTLQAVDDVRNAGVDFVFNTPNDLSRPGYLKMGWQIVGRAEPVIKILNYPKFLLGITRSKLLKRPGNALTDRCFTEDVPESISSLINRTDVDVLIGKDAAIWKGSLRTKQSSAYLDWRYAKHPTIDYRAVTVESEGHLEALAIFRANSRFGLREIVLAEMFLESKDIGIARKLIKKLTSQIRADYVVGYYPVGSFHRLALQGNSFRKIPGQGMTLTANPLSGPLSDLENLDNWGLSMGDLELL